MKNLTMLSAKALIHLIQTKQVSCVDVMQAYLAQIAKVNPIINAMTQLLPPEKALEQARIADKAILQNTSLGKLHGLPITIKDGRKVKGFMCTFGNKSPMNHIATEDATVVARLRAAGAIVVSIANIPDFSMSYETDNKLFGSTKNPYDLTHSSGGSSGGVASIIAAGRSSIRNRIR